MYLVYLSISDDKLRVLNYSQESLPGRASTSDFKDAATPRFGHSDAVFVYF